MPDLPDTGAEEEALLLLCGFPQSLRHSTARASLQRLQALRIPSEMIWGIYALYEQVVARVQCPGGLSEAIASTVGVKQGCPLSPTLFGLYIDEVADYIVHGGGGGVDLAGTSVHIMLYADDIILISESQVGLQ